MTFQERYDNWLQDGSIDEGMKAALRELAKNPKELEESFYKELEFGTGGLRGIIGAGSNRMNIYTVGKATQGLANYILKQGQEGKGVAVAYDSRNMSFEFARETGLVLAANGIKAYVYKSLRPVPVLSFTLRHLGCISGVVVTASHNPPEYNGYKVYWEDGAQVVAPHDTAIIDEVNKVDNFKEIKKLNFEEAVKSGLYKEIGDELDDLYDKNVLEQSIRPDIAKTVGDKFKIVYTPLHGSGNLPVRRVLDKAGFKNVIVVKEQELPDGDFPTIPYPNPEDAKVYEMSIPLAEKENAQIIIGTDPDCDRLGTMVRNDKGEFITLTGNVVGMMLTNYILEGKKEQGTLPDNGVVINTIVSTKMIAPICKEYGVECMEVLTGFKFIGEKIKGFEASKSHTYLLGFEESYGYLAGTYARDKDGVCATLLFCEMAAYYESQGKTVYSALMDLYEKYGYYQEEVKSITLKGIDGLDRIQRIMEAFRGTTPESFAGKEVVVAKDYQKQVFKDLKSGKESASPLPKSNVLSYTLSGEEWICIRPSGTEPKLKFYIGTKGKTLAEAKEMVAKIVSEIETRIDAIK
ncbi:MAG: phospho-sugar mutase [Bacillota bacterium]